MLLLKTQGSNKNGGTWTSFSTMKMKIKIKIAANIKFTWRTEEKRETQLEVT